MGGPVVRADYDQLSQAAGRFRQEAAAVRQTLARVRREQERLQAGDWAGKGAQAFQAEMNRDVLPTLRRLERALEQAAVTTGQIRELMRQTEAEAAAYFRLDGLGASAGGVANAVAANLTFETETGAKFGMVKATGKVSGGTAFVKGSGDLNAISPNDVDQGALGDCYLLASLGAIAAVSPDTIRRMIVDNKDGTFTVRFPSSNPLRPYTEVTVTPDFPSNDGATPLYAGYGDVDASGKPEIWVALIEKAYAQMTWSGDYASINGGHANNTLTHLLGGAARSFRPEDMSFKEVADYLESGNAVVVDTPQDNLWMHFKKQSDPRYQSRELIPAHSYYVTKVDRANGTISLRNPWGWKTTPETVVTMAEFQDLFRTVHVAQPQRNLAGEAHDWANGIRRSSN